MMIWSTRLTVKCSFGCTSHSLTRRHPDRSVVDVSVLPAHERPVANHDDCVTVEAQLHADTIYLAVRETGVGLEADQLMMIFERFYILSAAKVSLLGKRYQAGERSFGRMRIADLRITRSVGKSAASALRRRAGAAPPRQRPAPSRPPAGVRLSTAEVCRPRCTGRRSQPPIYRLGCGSHD